MTGTDPHPGWVLRDLDLLDPPLRPRVTQLRTNLPRKGASEIAEHLRLAIDAAFAGDQHAAAACIARAESLRERVADNTRARPGPPPASRKARTIIRRGITGHIRKPSRDGQVLVATDGSADRGGFTGWAYLATSGQWGCQAGEYRSSGFERRGGVNGNSAALITELRAVHLALTTIPGQVTILADSIPALRLLKAWQNGNVDQMPVAYSLRPRASGATPTLVKLADLVAERSSQITYTHVKGHAGHVLNEAADALAKIARRWLRSSEKPGRDAMTARAADFAAAFLATWHQTTGATDAAFG